MSESEMLAVDIMHDVTFSEDPKDVVEAREWRFRSHLKMAPLDDLMLEVKKRARSIEEFLEIMHCIMSERLRRLKSFLETYSASNKSLCNQSFSLGAYETVMNEFRCLIDSIKDLEGNECYHTSDIDEQSELIKIRAIRLIRRLNSIEYSIIDAMANAHLGGIGEDLKERIKILHERMKKLGIKI